MASYREIFRCASAKHKYSLRSIVNAIIADGGYRGKRLSDTLKATQGCELEAVLRPDKCPSKFKEVPPKADCRKVLRLVGKL